MINHSNLVFILINVQPKDFKNVREAFLKKIDHASSEHADNNSAADTHTPGRYPLSVGQ